MMHDGVRTGHVLRSRMSGWAALMLMCLGAWIMVYPYLYAVGGSFKSRAEFTADKEALVPPRLRPGKLASEYLFGRHDAAYEQTMRTWPPLRNYHDAIVYGGIDRFLCNSFLYALVTTAGSLLFSTLAAYAFARMRFPGRDLMFGMLLTTMMIPSIVTLIPQFLVIRHLGLVDHPLGVVLPSFVSAFGIFLLRQFFLNIRPSWRTRRCSTAAPSGASCGASSPHSPSPRSLRSGCSPSWAPGTPSSGRWSC